jgi:TetR/AcrR family transcriptional repressor of lmrAB and yxaGH operons
MPPGRGTRVPKDTSLPSKKIDGRDAAVSKLVELFYELGFEGTSLKRIEERTGLGRASLYNYFPGGKVEMARSVLLSSAQWIEEFELRVFEDRERAPQDRLAQILSNIDAVHSYPAQLSPSNAFCVGESRANYSEHIQAQYHFVANMLTDLMQACGVRAETALRRAWEFNIVWEGALVCGRVLGDLGMYRALMRQMQAYLLADDSVTGLLPADIALPTPPRR